MYLDDQNFFFLKLRLLTVIKDHYQDVNFLLFLGIDLTLTTSNMTLQFSPLSPNYAPGAVFGCFLIGLSVKCPQFIANYYLFYLLYLIFKIKYFE